MTKFYIQLTKTIVVEIDAASKEEAAATAVQLAFQDPDGSWANAEAQAVVLDPETSQEMKQ